MAGGAETHLFEIFGRLADRGVATELLCSGFAGAPARDSHAGVAISRVGSRLSFYARVPGEVRRRVAAGAVDLVVEAHNKVPFLVPLYANVPVSVIHHHLHGWTAFRQVPPWIAGPSVLLEGLIPAVYRRCETVTISKSSKADLARRGLPEHRISLVPCGIDRTCHRPAPIENRAPIVLSLGRPEPYKRIDLLVRAFRAVIVDVPEARLVIAGRGQEEGRLRRLVEDLGLSDHVHFTGFVDAAHKEALLQRAAVLVQCSTKEGWGMTVTEAAACGTPTVATDVPGLSDSVQDGVTGLLVHRARPEVLAGALVRLLLDAPERERLARGALDWARQFDWNMTAEPIRRILFRAAGLSARSEPQTANSSPVPLAQLASRGEIGGAP